MMVRNESAWIARTIASVAPAVDRVVVVDTGSTDDTVALARAAGAEVSFFPWCDDFSAARNASIDAAQGSDWVLIVDADHLLGPGTAETIRAAAQAGQHQAYRLPTHEAKSVESIPEDVVSGKKRRGRPWHPVALMRRVIGGEVVRYENPVHEDVMPWLLERGVDVPALGGANIVHYGGCRAVRTERGSDARNHRLLEAWRVRDPQDLTPYHYLAQEAYTFGDSKLAAEIVHEALSQPVRRRESPKVFSLFIIGAMAAIELQDLDHASRLLHAAHVHGMGAPHPDASFLRGVLCEETGDREAAIAYYTESIRLDAETWSSMQLAGSTTWAPWHRMGVCLYELGRLDDAMVAVNRALAHEGDGYEGEAREDSVRLRDAIVQAKGAA